LTQAQKQAGMQNIRVLMETVAPLVGANDPYGVMDNFDVDEIARVAHDSSGAEAKVMRSKRDRDKTRAQKVQAAQQQQQMMQAQQIAETAKTASQVDLATPNGATALMGAMGQ
jgi:hypothetical protein